MFSFRKFNVVLLFLLLAMCAAAVAAQDTALVTNTPGAVLGVEVTSPAVPVVISTVVAPAPHDTADAPTNPRGWLTYADIEPYIPYLFGFGVMLLLVTISAVGTALYFAYQHLPAWARPFVPMAISAADAGVLQIDSYAKSTPDDWDDRLAAVLDQKWATFKQELYINPPTLNKDSPA